MFYEVRSVTPFCVTRFLTRFCKGGAVAVMDVTNYIEKTERQFNSKDLYCQLSKNQTAANNGTVNNIIERFQKENLIIKNVAEGLKTTST